MKEHIDYIINSNQSDRHKLDILTELVYRQNGYTTRLVDEYIQQLFTTGKIQVKDHYPNISASQDLVSRILNRLQLEHNLTKKDLEVNKNTFEITYKAFDKKQEDKKYLKKCIGELKFKLNITNN